MSIGTTIKDSVIWTKAPAIKPVQGMPVALGTISGVWSSLMITGIPAGAILSDGTGNTFTATGLLGSVDVAGWNLGTLSIIPASDSNFVLTAVTGTGKWATEKLTVAPPAPDVSWSSSVTGIEGKPISLGALTATASGMAADGTPDTLKSIILSGLPAGARISDGHGHGFTASATKGWASISGWSLDSLVLQTKSDSNVTLTVTVTERDVDGNLSTATASETVIVNPLAPKVTWAPAPLDGKAGAPIALGDITATAGGLAGDGAGNVIQSLVVSNLRAGATLSDGSGHSYTAPAGGGATDVTGWSVADLSLVMPMAGKVFLTLTATETDAEGNTSTAVAHEYLVVAAAAADLAPTLTAGAPDAVLVEAALQSDGSTVAGVGQATVQLAKADPDGVASYDTTGWTANPDGTFSHGATYGVVVLDTAADTLTYQLDNSLAATDALGAGQVVTDSVMVKVIESPGTLTASTSVSFTIDGSNDAPVFTSAATTTSLAGTLAASDAEGNAISFALAAGQSAAGSYGSIALDGASGAWTFTLDSAALAALTPGTLVADTFNVVASDGNGGDTAQSLAIDLVAGGTAPAFTSAPVSLSIDDTTAQDWFGAFTGTLTAADGNLDPMSYALSGSGNGTYGSMSIDAAGNWTYTPANGAINALQPGQTVTDSFTAMADNGIGGTASQTMTVTLTGANDGPVFGSNASVDVFAGTTMVTALATDPDGPGAIGYTLGGADAAAFKVVNNQLAFVATPDPAVQSSYNVNVTASDGIASASQSYVVNVVAPPAGSPFTVIDPMQTASNGAAVTGALLAGGPGISADVGSLQVIAGTSSAMFYDGSLGALGIGAGLLITSGTMPATSNTAGYFGQDNGMQGSPALDAIVRTVYPTTPGLPGPISYDATSITFNFTVSDPTITGISLNTVFGSDEYPEWVDLYVDLGAVLVNGVNVAYFNNNPLAPLSVIGGNLAAGYFQDNTANLDASGTAIPGVPSTLPIEYDGVSRPLTIYAPVHQGLNTIEVAVADTGDHIYDSGLFISNMKATNAPTSGVVLDHNGTEADDVLVGTAAAESFDGKGGNDSVDAGGGNDILLGGAGDDTLLGGSGDDFLDGGTGHNLLDGGAGNDTIQHTAGTGVDTIEGGSGINTLALNDASASTADVVDLTNPAMLHWLNDGSSFVDIQVLSYHGGSGNDAIIGGAYGDVIDGGSGNDTLTGGAGNDTITGGSGNDIAAFSGNHDQYVITTIGSGLYQFAGPDGTDQVSGVEQFAFADGTYSIAALLSPGVSITGTVDDDVINATHAPLGQPHTTDNGDTIDGKAGDDHITGGAGADSISGGAGNDFINGGAGNDTIYAGAGNDEISGGLGADLFLFKAATDSIPADPDVILDFSQAQGDRIDLTQIGTFAIVSSFTGHAFELTISQHGDGYLVRGDTHGTGAADFALQVNTNAMLTLADFVH